MALLALCICNRAHPSPHPACPCAHPACATAHLSLPTQNGQSHILHPQQGCAELRDLPAALLTNRDMPPSGGWPGGWPGGGGWCGVGPLRSARTVWGAASTLLQELVASLGMARFRALHARVFLMSSVCIWGQFGIRNVGRLDISETFRYVSSASSRDSPRFNPTHDYTRNLKVAPSSMHSATASSDAASSNMPLVTLQSASLLTS
eukprot:354519-Chlamydomonas_euryale.AAC.7